jgi:hypothetical protein
MEIQRWKYNNERWWKYNYDRPTLAEGVASGPTGVHSFETSGLLRTPAHISLVLPDSVADQLCDSEIFRGIALLRGCVPKHIVPGFGCGAGDGFQLRFIFHGFSID